MASALKWPWIWAAAYAVAGGLCLVAIAYEAAGQAFAMSLPGFSLACLLGCGLLALLTKGLSIREGVLASCMIGAAQLFDGTGGVIEHALSTAMVCVACATLGGRIGAYLSASWHPLLDRVGRVGLAALILIGAAFMHTVIIAIVKDVAPNLLTALSLVAVTTTPSLAGAALQHTQRKPAEQSLAASITAIIIVIDALFLWQGYSLGLMCLCTLVLIFIGAAVYALALPGLMTVQACSSWKDVDPQVPQAIAMQGTVSPTTSMKTDRSR